MNNLLGTIRIMSDKYTKKLDIIERGLEQLLKDATEKTNNAIIMKREALVMTGEVDEELKRYKSTREVTEELINKKMDELGRANNLISEIESEMLMESQKKLADINIKIEEAKTEASHAIIMSETVAGFRKLLENRSSY